MDGLFLTINAWLTGGSVLALAGAMSWGVVSVLFSPCHLASIPLIIGYVGGQSELVEGRKAVGYSVLFSLGLFVSIAMVGVACALLGRMLGDVGPFWTLAVGALLLWVAADMLGVASCSMPGLIGRLSFRGMSGAFLLGLAYGVLSGSCTFGFIAPILAIVSVQQTFAFGLVLIVLFGLGHCLPIAVAGSATAWVRRLLASSDFHAASRRFRQAAGVLVGCLGIWFILQPFIAL